MAKGEREPYLPLKMIQLFTRQDRASRSRRGIGRAPFFVALVVGGVAVALIIALFGGR